jgi:RNA polymerase-binding transcription factor DksA
MRANDKLTRNERRDIEALLISEIKRLERIPGVFDIADEDGNTSAWRESPVSDSAGTASPSALLHKVGHYQALMNALQRLRSGTYGQCIHCGRSIPLGRLLVIPETEHCLSCGSFS